MSGLAPADADLLLDAARAAATAAASAALVLAVAARPWRGRAEATRAWGPPLALGTAVAVAFWMTRGRPSFPPEQALHWLFFTALAAAAWGALESRWPRARVLRFALAAALPVALLGFQRQHHWTPLAGSVWTAGLAALVLATWSALAAFESRATRGAAAALGLACAEAVACAAYALAGASLFVHLPLALALALGLTGSMAAWKRGPALGVAGLAPFVLLHSGFVWAMRWLYELSPAGFVLLMVAPLALLLSGLVPAERGRLRGAVAFFGPVLVASAALWAELRGAAPSPYG